MHPDWMDHINKRLVELETRSAVNAVHRINVNDRLSSIEDTLKWLVRLILGGMILAVLSILLDGRLPV